MDQNKLPRKQSSCFDNLRSFDDIPQSPTHFYALWCTIVLRYNHRPTNSCVHTTRALVRGDVRYPGNKIDQPIVKQQNLLVWWKPFDSWFRSEQKNVGSKLKWTFFSLIDSGFMNPILCLKMAWWAVYYQRQFSNVARGVTETNGISSTALNEELR